MNPGSAHNPSSHAPHGALSGFRVLELGWRVAASGCGTLLAQLGAEVIVVEPEQDRQDGKWRHRAAAVATKHSLVLSGNSPEDHEQVRRLVDCADVVIASSDAGDPFSAWDMPHQPSSILCDITAFGHSGPLAHQGGAAPFVEALTGVLDTNGSPDRPPVPCGADVLEFSASFFATAAVLTALHARHHDGLGQRIDIALYDTAVNALVNFIPLHLSGQAVTRSGNRHPLHTPWGCYAARDGHVLICSVTAHQFQRICQAIGQPELAQDERFATSAARLLNYRLLDQAISEWVAKLSSNECMDELTRCGIACGPVVGIGQLASEPNLQFRGSVVQAQDQQTGAVVELPIPPISTPDMALRLTVKIPARDQGRALAEQWLERKRAQSVAAPPRAPSPVRQPALRGFRVVEIGQYTVAPLVSRHLGSLGAEVIKIESPEGDAIRRAAPLRADGRSMIFALSNTDKNGLVLDLRRPDHQDALHKLLSQSDVLVENLKPGSLAKLGFSGPVLRQRHPHLVYCPINGFGLHSAYPGRPALDTVVQAMSGLMDLMREQGQPMKTGISSSDTLGGQAGLVAVLAGLLHRQRTGVAPHFDISMQDASCWITQMEWAGAQPKPVMTVLPARDGHVLVQANAKTITAVLPQSQDLTREQIVARLRSGNIAACPVLQIHEVLDSPQVKQRGLLIERSGDDGTRWVVLGSPMGLQGTAPTITRVMGPLGSQDQGLIDQFMLGIEPLTITRENQGEHA